MPCARAGGHGGFDEPLDRVACAAGLEVYRLGRLPLYSLGLILTFNLRPNITFITLYPFALCATIWFLERYQLVKPLETNPVSASQTKKTAAVSGVKNSFRPPRHRRLCPRQLQRPPK